MYIYVCIGFFEMLNNYNENIVLYGLYQMAMVLHLNLFIDPIECFEDSLAKLTMTTSQRDMEDTKIHCRLPRLVITPTRMIFFEPDILQVSQSVNLIYLIFNFKNKIDE